MKKSLKLTLITLFTFCTALVCGGYYMLGFALRPEELATRSRNMEASAQYMFDTYPELRPWVDSLQHAGALRHIYMDSDDGETLHALYVEAAKPTNKTALIVHGYTDNAVRMLMIGRLYSKVLGYNILLPDLHAHGMSGGNTVRMGWHDRLDVLQWATMAEELFRATGDELRAATPSLVIHGISMGAATTMMVSGEVEHGVHQNPSVKCFVEDCGYTSVWDEFRSELKAQFHLPAFPLLHVASFLCDMEYGWNFREASPLEQVKKCTLPMLFIHGDTDTFVPTWMVYPLYEAKPGAKELWIAPGTDHAHAYRDHKEEYTNRVKRFVEKYM